MIYVIGDLHLSFSTDKPMERFGEEWREHFNKIREDWLSKVREDDVVMLAGDTSWAMRYEEARVDFAWIDSLPGKKVIIKGNHDYWWSFRSKLAKEFGSLFFISSNHYAYGRYAIVGTRGWDIPGEQDEENRRIYNRELVRLRNSFDTVPRNRVLIGMVHYPPSPGGEETEMTRIFTDRGVSKVYYGHLHGNLGFASAFEGRIGQTNYRLISCDYTGFKLVRVECGSAISVDRTDFADAAHLLERRLSGIALIEKSKENGFGKQQFIEYNFALAKDISERFHRSAPCGAYPEEVCSRYWLDEVDERLSSMAEAAVSMSERSVLSVADGLIKYNYINSVCKKLMLEAEAYEFSNPERFLSLRRMAHFLYERKESVTEGLCDALLEEDTEVSFYPISLRSDALNGHMYEIFALPEEKVILHTMSDRVIGTLKNAGIMEGELRRSAVDSYVNATFYE